MLYSLRHSFFTDFSASNRLLTSTPWHSFNQSRNFIRAFIALTRAFGTHSLIYFIRHSFVRALIHACILRHCIHYFINLSFHLSMHNSFELLSFHPSFHSSNHSFFDPVIIVHSFNAHLLSINAKPLSCLCHHDFILPFSHQLHHHHHHLLIIIFSSSSSRLLSSSS